MNVRLESTKTNKEMKRKEDKPDRDLALQGQNTWRLFVDWVHVILWRKVVFVEAWKEFWFYRRILVNRLDTKRIG